MARRSPKNTGAQHRLSIFWGDLGELPIPALEFLILHLNTLQSNVEFQFLPPPQNSFIGELIPYTTLKKKTFNSNGNKFVDSLTTSIASMEEGFELVQQPIGRVVIISLLIHEDNLYSDPQENYSAIFLGHWKENLAPPSLLEFIISLVIMEGIDYLTSELDNVTHIGTRGCVGDFNSNLDVRNKILQGYLCSDCRDQLQSVIGEEGVESWLLILKKTWFGSLDDPMSPATIVQKLGYNLFLTKGFTPSRRERIMNTLSEDGVKEAIRIAGGLILAALLIWLSLNKS